MKLGIATAASVVGIEGHPVRIEAALLPGLPAFSIVGLADTAVSESRERIRAAFAASGIDFPNTRITVNLSPADIPKYGTAFDLGIACAILGALGGHAGPPNSIVLGELGLDGSVRPVRGVLPACLGAIHRGLTGAVVPVEAVSEAELAGSRVRGVWHLTQVARAFGVRANPVPPCEEAGTVGKPEPTAEPDLADVRGQAEARLALEMAAAGEHHLFMVGPPGVGKSMLAVRLPGIMPPLTHSEGIEVAAVRSLLGSFDGRLPTRRPFADPHHTASAAALVGGGSSPRPGAISRAHHGVLFLDELAEFAPAALEALREPMETGRVHISRARTAVVFPARFQLVGAANPCRCGKLFDGGCTCSPASLRAYRGRLSGPLMDRFDLKVRLRRPSAAELTGPAGEPSSAVRARVEAARGRQAARFSEEAWDTNGHAPGEWLRSHTEVPAGMRRAIRRALTTGALSARGVDKLLRAAWTVADLAGAFGTAHR